MTLTTEMLALREAAGRADQGEGQHIYTHPRDSNNYAANEAWHVAASPAAILALLAQLEAAGVPAQTGTQPKFAHYSALSRATKDASTEIANFHASKGPNHEQR